MSKQGGNTNTQIPTPITKTDRMKSYFNELKQAFFYPFTIRTWWNDGKALLRGLFTSSLTIHLFRKYGPVAGIFGSILTFPFDIIAKTIELATAIVTFVDRLILLPVQIFAQYLINIVTYGPSMAINGLAEKFIGNSKFVDEKIKGHENTLTASVFEHSGVIRNTANFFSHLADGKPGAAFASLAVAVIAIVPDLLALAGYLVNSSISFAGTAVRAAYELPAKITTSVENAILPDQKVFKSGASSTQIEGQPTPANEYSPAQYNSYSMSNDKTNHEKDSAPVAVVKNVLKPLPFVNLPEDIEFEYRASTKVHNNR